MGLTYRMRTRLDYQPPTKTNSYKHNSINEWSNIVEKRKQLKLPTHIVNKRLAFTKRRRQLHSITYY